MGKVEVRSVSRDGLNVEIRTENNTADVKQTLQSAVADALYALGVDAVQGAVYAISGRGEYSEYQAVDTGRLRGSLSFVVPDGKEMPEALDNTLVKENNEADRLSGRSNYKDTVIVGTNVEYAEFVHNGTQTMPPRPFLKAGIESKADEMQKHVKEIFENAKKEVNVNVDD